MALNSRMFEELAKRLKPGARIASMGYPDVIAPLDEIEEVIGEKVRSLTFRHDSQAICKRHGLPFRGIPDAAELFSVMGATLDVYDIVNERGCEIECDLNYDSQGYLEIGRGKYDFVLDVGTLEHCFNIGQAALNMAELVREGGWIIHENPFLMPNHGFYSLNPTWYADFYEQNGFEVECILLGVAGSYIKCPPTQRFKLPDTAHELTILAVARRVKEQCIVWPMQTKYMKATPAAGGQPGVKEAA